MPVTFPHIPTARKSGLFEPSGPDGSTDSSLIGQDDVIALDQTTLVRAIGNAVLELVESLEHHEAIFTQQFATWEVPSASRTVPHFKIREMNLVLEDDELEP